MTKLSNITELASEIVAAHASSTPMTKEELLAELQEVHAVLSSIEKGRRSLLLQKMWSKRMLPLFQNAKPLEKTDLLHDCGKGFTTLKRHLRTAHEMTPKEYRDKFDIPASTKLASKDYSESRRQMAIEKDLGAGLAKARASKAKK